MAPVGHPAVVGGKRLVQAFHVSVLHQGQQGGGFHHRALFAPLGEHQVLALREAGGRRFAGEVHHGADGPRLGFHDDADAGPHVRIFPNLGAEGLVGHVLEIHVEGGPYIVSVLDGHHGGIQVAHPAAVVRDAAPFVALVAVELAVKAVLDTPAGDVLHIADGAAGQRIVGINALLVLLGDESARVRPLLVQGEGLHQVQRLQIHVLLDEKVLVALVAALEDETGVLVGALVAEMVAQVHAQLAGLASPERFQAVFPLVLIILALHGAVHVKVVERGRYGHRPPVRGQNLSAYGSLDVLFHRGAEQADYLVVHMVGGLDMDDAGENSYPEEQEDIGQEEHNHVDSVAVFYGVLYFALSAAHFFLITVAGSLGEVTGEPSCFRRVRVVDALCSFTSSASFCAW